MILYICIGGICCVGIALATLIAYDLGNKKGYAAGYSRGLDHAQVIASAMTRARDNK